MKLGVSLACALAVFISLAPQASGASNRELRAAQAAYRSLRFDSALTHLNLALERPSSRADLIRILEMRGLTLAVLERWREARLPFRKLLTLDPKHILPDYVSPRFRTFFADIRRRARSAGRLAASDATAARGTHDAPIFVALRLENDPAGMATQVRVRYRLVGAEAWKELQSPAGPMTRARLRLGATPDGVEYTWTLLDDADNELLYLGTAKKPLMLDAAAAPPALTPPSVAAISAVDAAPIWKQWWLWTAVGVVVVGAAVATAVIVSRPDTPDCPTGVSCASF